MWEIKKVEGEITAFDNQNKHYTKQYRTLEGCCRKLMADLDRIEVFNTGLRDERKEAYKRLQHALDTLMTKVHDDGRTCPMCEVQT